MRFGFVFPGTDPREALACAEICEAAGWDAFFVWDSVWGTDPWVLLGALAARTKRLRLGTMITPVSRRRPWNLAAQAATLDALSEGRAILSVGLGAIDTGFDKFGEATDRKQRAEMLDEGLEIITGLWRGQPFEFHGRHYHVLPTTFMPAPAPVQQPRIPIWVVGLWGSRRSLARALRYDGLLPYVKEGLTPAVVAEMRAYLDLERPGQPPLDLIVEGLTPLGDPAAALAQVAPLAEAGATWWNEAMWGEFTSEQVLARARQGPPRGNGDGGG